MSYGVGVFAPTYYDPLTGAPIGGAPAAGPSGQGLLQMLQAAAPTAPADGGRGAMLEGLLASSFAPYRGKPSILPQRSLAVRSFA